jgi:hypothetical protein
MTIYRTRIRWIRVAGLLAAVAALAVLLGRELPASPSATVTAPIQALRGELRDLRREHGPGLGTSDGAVPGATTVFDDGVPGVARLDADLLLALRRAAGDAASAGVTFVVDSGWRSPAYQQRLLDDAVAKYGSAQEAARWVATPKTSAHVSGDAVDLGPSRATTWLSEHGAAYGLCRTYANEPWHYELRPEATTQGCPPAYADPTQDPRMRR